MKSGMTIMWVIALMGLTLGVNAQDTSKASKPSAQMQQVKTVKDFEALPSSATIAMACAKCKSIVVMGKKKAATKPGHGTVDEALVVHQCPGCGGKMTTKSDGKETMMKHICSQCGDDSAFCCATKAGEKTEGM